LVPGRDLVLEPGLDPARDLVLVLVLGLGLWVGRDLEPVREWYNHSESNHSLSR